MTNMIGFSFLVHVPYFFMLLFEKCPIGGLQSPKHFFDAFCLAALSAQRLMAKTQILDNHSNVKHAKYQIMKLLVQI